MSASARADLTNFFLYLRPFSSDGRITISGASNKVLKWVWMAYRVGALDATHLENWIRLALEEDGFLVSLGGLHPNFEGGGRITCSDLEWKETFSVLAASARSIFVVPSLHPGTKYELEWIAQARAWDRVVLVFCGLHSDSNESKFQKEKIRDHLCDLGLQIPSALPDGSFLAFDRLGNLVKHVVDDAYKKATIRMFSNRLLW